MTVIDSPSLLTKIVKPGTTTRPTESRTVADRLRRALPPIGAFVLAIALWQLDHRCLRHPSYMLPSPWALLETLWDRTDDDLATDLGDSSGVLPGVLGGHRRHSVAIALVMARWNITERGFYPYLIVLQTIPIVAIAPLFVVWIGPGQTTNMLVAP